MKIKDKKRAIKRYEERFKKFGKSVKTIGWRDKKQQALRFKVLAEIGDLRTKRILDVGCGFGDFYSYLLRKGVKVNYTGYDISSKIIAAAKTGYPKLKLEIKDILTDRVGEKFDYVFSSGVFNHRILDNLRFTREMIKKMLDISKIGVAVNMMTDYVDYKEKHLFYYSPEAMFKFAKGLSHYVVLRHDYPLFEFTIYIYKITS